MTLCARELLLRSSELWGNDLDRFPVRKLLPKLSSLYRTIYLIFHYLGTYFCFQSEVVVLLTDYLLEACREQIIFRAQQARTGNRKLYP